jgi:hypothetical protein
MQKQKKSFASFRKGRINSRQEARQQLIIRNNLEKRFVRKLDSLFRKFTNVHMFLYTQFGIYERDIATGSLNEDFIPLVLSHYRRVSKNIYEHNERMNNQKEAFVFGRSIDFERQVEEYFKTRTLFLQGITANMSARISRDIVKLRAEGLTISDIARSITAKYNLINLSRARMIARTETHNAASFASHQYHTLVEQDLGTKLVKKWVATNDARTRPDHAEVNGKTVGMNEDFIVGGVPMSYAGDPKGGAKNVINCRCVIIYADEDDEVT